MHGDSYTRSLLPVGLDPHGVERDKSRRPVRGVTWGFSVEYSGALINLTDLLLYQRFHFGGFRPVR